MVLSGVISRVVYHAKKRKMVISANCGNSFCIEFRNKFSKQINHLKSGDNISVEYENRVDDYSLTNQMIAVKIQSINQ